MGPSAFLFILYSLPLILGTLPPRRCAPLAKEAGPIRCNECARLRLSCAPGVAPLNSSSAQLFPNRERFGRLGRSGKPTTRLLRIRGEIWHLSAPSPVLVYGRQTEDARCSRFQRSPPSRGKSCPPALSEWGGVDIRPRTVQLVRKLRSLCWFFLFSLFFFLSTFLRLCSLSSGPGPRRFPLCSLFFLLYSSPISSPLVL